jgi:hypothetical protein
MDKMAYIGEYVHLEGLIYKIGDMFSGSRVDYCLLDPGSTKEYIYPVKEIGFLSKSEQRMVKCIYD